MNDHRKFNPQHEAPDLNSAIKVLRAGQVAAVEECPCKHKKKCMIRRIDYKHQDGDEMNYFCLNCAKKTWACIVLESEEDDE